jgi:hypothetical protein
MSSVSRPKLPSDETVYYEPSSDEHDFAPRQAIRRRQRRRVIEDSDDDDSVCILPCRGL